MSNRVLVSVQDGMASPDWACRIGPFAQKALSHLGFDGEEISVLLCNDAFIRELNLQYRNIDAPTDVLSFEGDGSYEDEEGVWRCAGDIIISVETLPVNAGYFSETSDGELKRLLVHGILHLNGMDHGDEHIEPGLAPECEMLRLQEDVLLKLKDENIIV